MKTASWVILAVAGALTILGGLGSLTLAYVGGNDNVAPGATVKSLSAGNDEIATALRGRRATAAGYAIAFGVLFLAVAAGPYRRGDAWSWWALLASAAALLLTAALRIPMLGTRRGTGAAALLFVVTLVGLLLDLGRVRAPAPAPATPTPPV
jgi:hypothetical protein